MRARAVAVVAQHWPRQPGGSARGKQRQAERERAAEERSEARTAAARPSFSKALPSKDAREHAHMAPTALAQCGSGTKQSRRGR